MLLKALCSIPPARGLTKLTLRVMKLTAILMLIAVLQVSANGFAQTVSLNLQNAPLEKVFSEIEKQTGFSFVYASDLGKKSKPVTVQLKKATLEEALQKCFLNQPFTYKIVSTVIIVNTQSGTPLIVQALDKTPPIEITGRVVNEEGAGFPGVTVRFRGSDISTTTNAEGNFSMSIPGRGVLEFTHVGYEKQEFRISDQTAIRIQLQKEQRLLNEVVVVGFATQQKVNLTGSVAVIDGDQLAKRQVASTSVALQGMVPGVMVTQQSGLPGNDAGTIRVRGISSMFAGQNPLVLVDNVEMSFNAIDPNNIESISILKDAAAASIYGSRASNGVILITTKRGKRQGINLQYNGYAGFQRATNLPQKVNALEHMQLYDQGLQNVGRAPVYAAAIEDYEQNGPDNFSRFNTNWEDLMLSNNGLMHNHNLSVSGGSERINMFASGSFLDQDGLTANTNFKRYDFRYNADVKLLKNLTASMDLVLNRSDRKWPNTSPNILMMYMIGLPAAVGGKYNTGEYGEGWNNVNPVAQAEAGGFEDLVTKRSVLNGTLKYVPVKNLELLVSYSTNNVRLHTRSMIRPYQVFLPDVANNVLTPGPFYPAVNGLMETWNESAQDFFRSQFTYNAHAGDHSFKLLGGFSAEDYKSYTVTAGRQNFINPDLPYLNIGDAGTMTNTGGIIEWAIVSFYSRLNYQYKDRYLIELNGRADASSRFAAGNRWGFFPSVSAGWRISEENFWSGGLKNTINQLKVRASYGVLGNQYLSSEYPTVAQFMPGAAYNYFFNNGLASGYAITQAANPDIRWESSRQLDVGIDIGMFDNRLTFTGDYFERNIYDMLQTLPIPMAIGLTAPYVNAGAMKNTGWEMSIGWRDRSNDLSYGLQLNLSNVKNTVTDLKGEEYINGRNIIREGYAINSYYGYMAEGFFQSQDEIDAAPTHYPTTRPGDIRYKDISGADGKPDGIINNYDRVVLGNAFPQYEYSLNADVSWKGFDLSVFLQGVGERQNYIFGYAAWPFHATNFQGTAYEYHKDHWTPDNPDAAFPRLTVGIDNNQQNSSFWIRSGAYLRVKNAQLGYTLPVSITNRMKIRSVRFYVSGQNLFTFDKFFAGFDPEREDNTGQFYPIMKTFTFGVNLNL